MSDANSIKKSEEESQNNTISSNTCIYIHLSQESKIDPKKDSICFDSSPTYNHNSDSCCCCCNCNCNCDCNGCCCCCCDSCCCCNCE